MQQQKTKTLCFFFGFERIKDSHCPRSCDILGTLAAVIELTKQTNKQNRSTFQRQNSPYRTHSRERDLSVYSFQTNIEFTYISE